MLLLGVKRSMIGHTTFEVYKIVARTFALKVQSTHEKAERLDIENFFSEINPDLCQYAQFRDSGFTYS